MMQRRRGDGRGRARMGMGGRREKEGGNFSFCRFGAAVVVSSSFGPSSEAAHNT
jgi:hypothetical protein